MNNTIFLRRKQKILVIEKQGPKINKQYLLALQENLSSLGYVLSKEVLAVLSNYSVEEIGEFYDSLVKDLKEMLGAHVFYDPMYPNFPKQVKEATDIELNINSFFHYIGATVGIRVMPAYRKKRRPKFKDKVDLKIISLGSIAEFDSIFQNLISAKIAISPIDKADLEWFISNYSEAKLTQLIPSSIPLKENIAFVSAALIQHTNIGEEFVRKNSKTATDILRILVAMSGGDVSLAVKSKFKSIKRSHRRFILELLENYSSLTEDMLRYKEPWKRAGEYLHPYEYKDKFPRVFEAFQTIREDKPYQTFNGHIEKLLTENKLDDLVDILKQRPGELVRKLDLLIRKGVDVHKLVKEFEKVCKDVSSPVLLQALTHFKYRNHPNDLRIFFPKGEVAKAQAIDNLLPDLDEKKREKFYSVIKNELLIRFAKLPSLGKVYIDENLRNYTVPFALRSASKTLKTVGRGSTFDLSKKESTIRFFLWWKEDKSRVDIDLSALALDENYNFKSVIAYYNLRDMGGYHSGDITSAPNGASEFIDIDVKKFLNQGIKYLVMVTNSFTSQPYCDLPECFAGFMLRKKPDSGEIYEPKSVEKKFDLTSNTRCCIPLIVDLSSEKVIWTDLALKSNPSYVNNVHNNMSSLSLMTKAMTNLRKLSAYDLFSLHAEARGTIVANKFDAETIFAENEGITPFDVEEIIAKFI